MLQIESVNDVYKLGVSMILQIDNVNDVTNRKCQLYYKLEIL